MVFVVGWPLCTTFGRRCNGVAIFARTQREPAWYSGGLLVGGGWMAAEKQQQQQQRHQRCYSSGSSSSCKLTGISVKVILQKQAFIFSGKECCCRESVGVVCYCSQKNESARILRSMRIEWREINKRHCAGTCVSVRACRRRRRPSGNKVVQHSCSLGDSAVG